MVLSQWAVRAKVNLLSKAQQRGPAVFIDCLGDKRLWDSVGTPIQDLAIQSLERELGDYFDWVKTDLYHSGGVSCRIATFRFRLDKVRLDSMNPGFLGRLFSQTKAVSIELNLIPGGHLVLSNGRSVYVPPFLMGMAPLSQKSWDILEGVDKRRVSDPELAIHGLNWEEADLWLTRAGPQARMPSEVEWEYAARAGTTGAFYWGDTFQADHCWSIENSAEKPKSGAEHRGKSNAFGLQDLLGQVWEWCRDEYCDDFESGLSDALPRGDVSGYNPKNRALRGGCYSSTASDLSLSMRRQLAQEERDKTVGLRVVMSLPDYKLKF